MEKGHPKKPDTAEPSFQETMKNCDRLLADLKREIERFQTDLELLRKAFSSARFEEETLVLEAKLAQHEQELIEKKLAELEGKAGVTQEDVNEVRRQVATLDQRVKSLVKQFYALSIHKNVQVA